MTHSHRGAWRIVALTMMAAIAACSELAGRGRPDSGPINYGSARTVGVRKALVNNLVGRWYTKDEIARLDDDTMAPEEWCARAPSLIAVSPDDVEVRARMVRTTSWRLRASIAVGDPSRSPCAGRDLEVSTASLREDHRRRPSSRAIHALTKARRHAWFRRSSF